MNYKVVYFSRTGTSKKVAAKIAAKLSCETIEIKDNINWKGLIGFIKGGYYASKNKKVEISLSGSVGNADEIVLVTPLWAGGPAPAVTSFLKKFPSDKVHLVVTSKGSTIKNHSSGFKSITSIVRSNNNEDSAIENLVKSLSK
ncbi:hypothetical protein JK636_14925 [Clostridium sp. YIM B02515]|uniref:Flavodoxin n=1 Tax=Clostridium rhizosphaerae TaxID=2803861 RepID=A0ABS1TCP8_9CLOT|nr:hypothetical protein [Clostridium rhizosphaerae]MBL4937046.1 hypothetical protein [Clostridium rhizosphaerae]